MSIASPLRRFGFWAFIAFMSALTVLFAILGVWQMERLAWKEQLIADVAARSTLPPEGLPPESVWLDMDFDAWQFRPLSVTGHYIEGKTALVFISLSDARGRYSGPGYWVLSAFALDTGGTIFVNRGFIPQSEAQNFASGQGTPSGTVTLIGTATAPEEPGLFTPAPDLQNHIEWVRHPLRLWAVMGGVPPPVFLMGLDLPAGDAGALPQGGETRVEFPNNHLGYALTWFGFALITPALLAFWVWRQFHPARVAPAGSLH